MKIKNFIFAIALAAGVFSCSIAGATNYHRFAEAMRNIAALAHCDSVYDKLQTMEECPSGATNCIAFDVTLSNDGLNCLMTATSDSGQEDVAEKRLIGHIAGGMQNFWEPSGTQITITADSTTISVPITHDSFEEFDSFNYLILKVQGELLQFKRIYFTNIQNTAHVEEVASGTGGSDPAVVTPPVDNPTPPAETPAATTPTDALPDDDPPPADPIAPPDSSLLYDDGSCSLISGSASSFGKIILGVLFALTLVPMAICRKK